MYPQVNPGDPIKVTAQQQNALLAVLNHAETNGLWQALNQQHAGGGGIIVRDTLSVSHTPYAIVAIKNNLFEAETTDGDITLLSSVFPAGMRPDIPHPRKRR